MQAAPLFGVPVWLLELQLPSPPAPGRAAVHKAGLVRGQAANTLRFHNVIGLFGVGLCIAVAIAAHFDPSSPTMSNPPVRAEAVLVVGAISFVLVLPVLEGFYCTRHARTEFLWKGYWNSSASFFVPALVPPRLIIAFVGTGSAPFAAVER